MTNQCHGAATDSSAPAGVEEGKEAAGKWWGGLQSEWGGAGGVRTAPSTPAVAVELHQKHSLLGGYVPDGADIDKECHQQPGKNVPFRKRESLPFCYLLYSSFTFGR